LIDYWLAAADILNGANGGAWRRLRGLFVRLGTGSFELLYENSLF